MVRRKYLIIRRKGYRVSPSTYRLKGKLIRRKGYLVKPTVYRRRDIGAPGRGPKLIPIRKGKLAPYKTEMATASRRRILARKVRRYGATSVYRSLMAQVIFRKRMPNGAKRAFKQDAEWLKKKYNIGSR